jgi:Rieske Fe-S protein
MHSDTPLIIVSPLLLGSALCPHMHALIKFNPIGEAAGRITRIPLARLPWFLCQSRPNLLFQQPQPTNRPTNRPPDKTWDCPAHGSVFDACGRCVSGPSARDLEDLGWRREGEGWGEGGGSLVK